MKNRNRSFLISAFFTVLLIFLSYSSFAEDTETGKTPGRYGSKIAFNFVDVDIPTIIKFISKITGDNFIFDETIKGKITIIAPTELTIEESFTLFTSVLNLKGFTIIPAGTKTYTIVPSIQATQSGEISSGDVMPVDERYITRILAIENINAEDALKFLRPIVSKNGHLSVFGPRNLLMIVDSALNIEKVVKILERIDQPPTFDEPSKINIYFVEHADATDLAKVLEGIIKSTRAASQTTSDPKNAQADSALRISITPDKATNSLVIVASPSEYKNISEIIKALDKKRKQVFVEAMIIEASLDKVKAVGTKWRAAATHNGEPVFIGGVGNISLTTVDAIINGLSGFTAGGMGNFLTLPGSTVGSDSDITVPGFAALFSLSDFKDAINILSTPQILTADNEEAEIIVGENVPFISKREGNADSVASTYSTNIERQDVGISLKITPQITEGNYVKLNVYQEISSVKDASDEILIAVGPTTTKRSTKTTIIVKDAQTVVISGLMQEKEEESISKFPIMGDIPLLGWLFKHKGVTKTKTNLLLFLTPHVIKDAEQLTDITSAKKKTFATEENQYIRDELLVRFRDDVSKKTSEEIISKLGASVINIIKDLNIYHIKLRPKQNVEEAIEEFTSYPEVIYAEPNYTMNIQGGHPDKINTLPSPESSLEEKENNFKRFGLYTPTLSGLSRRW
ncbi:MAG: secretin N-terminal domain-containing protein [Thermodesulfovibrionia bacterium]|nr:secretin N-terminal domain-containing protein [Thermodesulfovibrionia bacterium]